MLTGDPMVGIGGGRKLSIIMMHRKTYPCSHAMLETVYSRILPQRGHEVLWIMRSAESRRIKNWEVVRWNDSTVYLVEGDRGISWLDVPRRFVRQYRVLQYLINRRCPDIIQVRNDWVTGLLAVLAQRRWGVPFVYQASIPYPEMLMLSNRRRMVGRLLKIVERLLMHEAVLVLPISRWMKDKLEQEGIPSSKMVSFPLGADTSICPEGIDAAGLRLQLGLENRPTVIYFGAMDRIRQLDFLLRVLGLLIPEHPDIRLLMVGNSERATDMDWLKGLASEMGLSEYIVFTGKVPRTEVPRHIVASDVVLSPIVPLPIYAISSPTKLVEAMAMSRPVVANDIPEQRTLLDESRAGLCTPYEERVFARTVSWLLNHPEEAREMGRRGREYVEAHRSYELLTTSILRSYARFVKA